MSTEERVETEFSCGHAIVPDARIENGACAECGAPGEVRRYVPLARLTAAEDVLREIAEPEPMGSNGYKLDVLRKRIASARSHLDAHKETEDGE